MTELELQKRISDSYELPNNVLDKIPSPMVSIRTSTYNHGVYIRQCIEGILMQKTNFPFEYIIGEDCSSDETREIVFEYAKKYPDIIRVVTADYNVGSKANGRRCIHKCRGKYMAICEGDDFWIDPFKLQKQVEFLEQHPKYFVVGMRSLLYYQDLNRFSFYDDSLHLKTSFKISSYVKHLLMHTSTFCIRRDYVPHSSPNGILQGDIYLILHSSFRGRLNIKVLKDYGSVYRIHSGGITKSKIHLNLEKSFKSLTEILNSYDVYSNFKDHYYISNRLRRDKLLMDFRLSTFPKKMKIGFINFFLFTKILFNYLCRKIEITLVRGYTFVFNPEMRNFHSNT